MKTIKEWQAAVYELSESNGFHGGPLGVHQGGEPALPQIGLKLMLAVGELAEALEELRDDPRKLNTYVNVPGGSGPLWEEDIEHLGHEGLQAVCRALGIETGKASLRKRMHELKPEGFDIELADTIIRCLDMGGALGLDLEAAMTRKHEYNKSRPFMHGKKA